jgi:DtxR family transcriptional regulator, Mn-dependent transcriptional regulator
VTTRSALHPGNTQSVDDYLKAIFELSGPDEARVTSNAIAERLNVRAASVTGMFQKLAANRPSLVKYEKHHGVRLTAAGKKRALEILRHHRLLEQFLHDFLDYGWDEVHEEAERLEHFISEKLEDRIAAKLGDPLTDPHGHLIPERSGSMFDRGEVSLLQWACGVPALISSVSDRDPSALRDMERMGLKPGAQILVEVGVRNSSLLMRVNGQANPMRVSGQLAARISVLALPRNSANPSDTKSPS